MSKELAIKQETTHLILSINQNNNPAELPMVISERESSLQIKDVFKCPLIIQLEVPKKEVIKTIRTLLMNTAKQYQWSKDMGVQEATTLAIDLHEVLKTETLEDIILMFNMARKGKLTDAKTNKPLVFKGRIDNESLFTQIVPAYLELKAQEREKNYQNKKHEKLDKVEPLTPEQKDNLKKLKESVTKNISNKRLQKKQEPTYPVNELCQEHFREYDRLKRYEPHKIPKRVTNSYDYLSLQFSKMKYESKPLTNAIIQKWAKEFWELREQDKLPDGIDTYTKFFEWKTF